MESRWNTRYPLLCGFRTPDHPPRPRLLERATRISPDHPALVASGDDLIAMKEKRIDEGEEKSIDQAVLEFLRGVKGARGEGD